MSKLNTISLHSLLEKQEVSALLQEFEALMPDTEVALFQPNGKLYVGTGEWPIVDLSQLVPQTSSPNGIGSDVSVRPLVVRENLVGALASRGTRPQDLLRALHRALSLLLAQALEKREVAGETLERYREVNLLYNIGETINTCLDPDQIPLLVLLEANRVIRAKVGLVLLPTPEEQRLIDVKASFGPANYVKALHKTAHDIIEAVYSSGQPAIAADLAIRGTPIDTVLCAPLKSRDRVLGVVLLGRLERRPVFTAGDEKLLLTLAQQAAGAFENANLFTDLTRQRDALTTMKDYMDNIFTSIASGVITIDAQDRVVTLNRAAQVMVSVDEQSVAGQHFIDGLPGLGAEIALLVSMVKQRAEQIAEYELETTLPRRGPVVFRLHISPLRDDSRATGVAIVLEDLTERRHLEQQVQQVRHTFERYVTPNVVEQLLSDPSSVRLGGVGQEVTVLFADIRNFSSFSEKVEPEALVEILNKHLTLAAEAVLVEEGTLDKFMGDAVMALFNAPLAQPDHTLRAVRAALAMQQAIAQMHTHILPPDKQLRFGVGITTGPAVVGNIGSDTIQNYTAIGDSVNMAQRLQTQALPNQILLNATAYQHIRQQVITRELPRMLLKGHSTPDRVFEVIGLVDV